ncbi:MAG: DUF2141 domain-containing protein [Rhodospirillales bacterium]|jgi:uncharacterized protein (DUF2141 family)|nr:DUF2141 domain-containing protein [Rhodospirillales bacterium]
MPKTRLHFTITTLTVFLLTAEAPAADLTVQVSGLRSDQGDVHMAVYNTPATFPDSDGMLHEVQTPIHQGMARYHFTNLHPGVYAIAIFHDENSNNDFDTNFIGLPLEGYAFSNDAQVFFGPPSFEEAQIQLSPDGSETHIEMTY